MTGYREVLDEAYDHFAVTNNRQVWGIAIGVFLGWLLYLLPREAWCVLRGRT